ncbi:hypothetical protein HHK36_005859 [Tetracentron sinense]|uniref:RNA polymerase Rpb4/RPC9 core domain-containing protein n=1 Tax=Tetracentron sinense TaxID=13715 RepID=A0A834ZQ78_TETSI|nr:hypothetical protein HHK36_005859 [Tetracentron sinense]
MAEKGGKGFSMPRGRKPSLKTTGLSRIFGILRLVSMKGKDGSSPMKGRKVQFDNSNSEGSPEADINISSKSGGKDSFKTPVAKGDSGKGGKGDKTSKGGGKSSVPKEPPIPELKIEDGSFIMVVYQPPVLELPVPIVAFIFPVDCNDVLKLSKNTKCLMDCEAALALQGVQEQLVILSEDPTIKMPVTFDKGLQYAKTGSHYRSPQSVRQALETLKRHGVSDGEICMIANICPETVDEVFSLIPSLKAKRRKIEQTVKEVLCKLAELKHE